MSILSPERSEKVSEIISREPSFLVRWGVVIIMSILTVLIISSFLIKYPDIVVANAYLNASGSPKEIITRSDGRLKKLFVSENQLVKEGELLGVIDGIADYTEVLRLSEIIEKIKDTAELKGLDEVSFVSEESFTKLGELQIDYQTFVQTWQTFNNYSKKGFFMQKSAMLAEELLYLQRTDVELLARKKLLQEDLVLSDSTYEANRTLRNQSVLSPLEMRSEKSKLINKQMTLPEINLEIITNGSRELEKKKEIAELNNQITLQKLIFQQALNTLHSQITNWRRMYLLTAPLEGTVVFPKFIQPGEELHAGQLICYVQSANNDYYVNMIVPQERFGKIRLGQKVILKLLAYPWQEYGSLQGEIAFISTIPVDSGYFTKVTLKRGSVTNKQHKIEFRSGLEAKAEIITDDRRLIERLIRSFSIGR